MTPPSPPPETTRSLEPGDAQIPIRHAANKFQTVPSCPTQPATVSQRADMQRATAGLQAKPVGVTPGVRERMFNNKLSHLMPTTPTKPGNKRPKNRNQSPVPGSWRPRGRFRLISCSSVPGQPAASLLSPTTEPHGPGRRRGLTCHGDRGPPTPTAPFTDRQTGRAGRQRRRDGRVKMEGQR